MWVLAPPLPSTSAKRSPGAPWHSQVASLAPRQRWTFQAGSISADAGMGRGARTRSRSARRTDFITVEETGLCGAVGGVPTAWGSRPPSEGAGHESRLEGGRTPRTPARRDPPVPVPDLCSAQEQGAPASHSPQLCGWRRGGQGVRGSGHRLDLGDEEGSGLLQELLPGHRGAGPPGPQRAVHGLCQAVGAQA